jgi:carboxymethylenebutenolidase
VQVFETVNVPTADGDMAVYVADSNRVSKGAVIVLQEAFGVTDHIQDVTRRISAEGFRAVAPHIYHRTGDPIIEYGDVDAMLPHRQALTYDGLLMDMDATVDMLAEGGFDSQSVGVIGFCLGGTIAFLTAAARRLGAAVTFYGGGIRSDTNHQSPVPPLNAPNLLDLAPGLQTPWLGLYGDKDFMVPVEHVELLREATSAAPVDTEVVRYPDGGHGFHCDARDSYHEESARDAWLRTLVWLDRHLTSGSPSA